MKMLMRVVIGAALLAGTSAVPAYANLITNGSFETAAADFGLPTGNGEALPTGSTAIAGWTVIGGHENDGLAWLPNSNGYGVSTPYGNYFLDLTGYHDTAPYFGVSQSISTVIGDKYALTFSLGVNQSSSIYNGPIGVSGTAGSTAFSVSDYNPNGTGNIWQTFTVDFVATSASSNIAITGVHGDQYIGLDNVAVNGVSAVPLPASAPMFGAALLALGAVGYGLKRKKAAA